MPTPPDEAKQRHGAILVGINKFITKESPEFEEFKTMAKSKLYPAEAESCKTMLELLELLEKNGTIEVGNYGFIFETFDAIGYRDERLLPTIQEGQVNIREIIAQSKRTDKENIGGLSETEGPSNRSFIPDSGRLPGNNPERSSNSDITHSDWYLQFPPKLKIEYYDVVIVYIEDDQKKARTFKEHLMNEIDLNCNYNIKAILHDETLPNSSNLILGSLKDAFERSTYIFLFITENSCKNEDDACKNEDETAWSEFFRSVSITQTMENPEKRWCFYPVIGGDLCGAKLPFGLESFNKLNYWLKDDKYLTAMKRILTQNMYIRIKKETQLRFEQRQYCLENCMNCPPETFVSLLENKQRQMNYPTSQQTLTSETLSTPLMNSEHDQSSVDSVCNTTGIQVSISGPPAADENYTCNIRKSDTGEVGKTENNIKDTLDQSAVTAGANVNEQSIPDHTKEPIQSHQGTSEDVESVLKEQIKERDGPMTNTGCVNITNVCCSGSRCTQRCCTCNIA